MLPTMVEIAVPLDIAGAGRMGEIIGLRQLLGGIGQPVVVVNKSAF